MLQRSSPGRSAHEGRRTTVLVEAVCFSTGLGLILDPWSKHDRSVDGAEPSGQLAARSGQMSALSG
jgi:hypothetical protein